MGLDIIGHIYGFREGCIRQQLEFCERFRVDDTGTLGDMVHCQRFFPSVTNIISYLESHFCIDFLST